MIYVRCDGWRYRPVGPIRIVCDAPLCFASTRATGTDHNGPQVEAIYRPPGWLLLMVDDPPDLCPVHAPPPDEEEVGNA